MSIKTFITSVLLVFSGMCFQWGLRSLWWRDIDGVVWGFIGMITFLILIIPVQVD